LEHKTQNTTNNVTAVLQVMTKLL